MWRHGTQLVRDGPWSQARESARDQRTLLDPVDEMMGQGAGLLGRNDPTGDGMPGAMDGGGVAAEEGVPVGQGLALTQQAVGTGGGEPARVGHVGRREFDAVMHQARPVGVIAAGPGVRVQQLTGHVGVEDAARLLFLQFLQAALAAAVAQGLPLVGAHGVQGGGFPEAGEGGGRAHGGGGNLAKVMQG